METINDIIYSATGLSAGNVLIRPVSNESPYILSKVTFHVLASLERHVLAYKSAILILRYGGVRQKQRILSFSIFFAQGMRKAL